MSKIRVCHSCGKGFTGRIDKQYCTDACKSKDYRRKKSELIYDQSPARMAICICSVERDFEINRSGHGSMLPIASSIDQVIYNESARAGFCLDLHQRFCDFTKAFINLGGNILNEGKMQEMFLKAGRLTELYNQHPFLQDPYNIVHERITCLNVIRKFLLAYGKVNFTSLSGKKPKLNTFIISDEVSALVKRHLEIPCFYVDRNDLKTKPGTRQKRIKAIPLM